uniref:Programmed cell death 5 n=1 Tax=Anolis carolinensis TaxID=28377 RepID=H9GCQ1_ANOCA
MADEELEALRKQRMAELQAKHGDPSSEIAQQESKQREAEMRNTILAQVLDQAARARCKYLCCFLYNVASEDRALSLCPSI